MSRMPVIPRDLPPLDGSEMLGETGASVLDYWRWGHSDLRANAERGVLAEFLVASALGDNRPRRDPWGNFDVLTPEGVKVEVKASGYMQSWAQRAHSKIVFSGLKSRRAPSASDWEALMRRDAPPKWGELWTREATYLADVYVFGVHTQRDPDAYDVLHVEEWDFYAISVALLREYDCVSVSLSWVRRHAEPVKLAGIREAVLAVA